MEKAPGWDVTLTFEVSDKNGQVYRNTAEWIEINPKKVRLMEDILAKAQAEFVNQASSV